jgi:hypothetical protein
MSEVHVIDTTFPEFALSPFPGGILVMILAVFFIIFYFNISGVLGVEARIF